MKKVLLILVVIIIIVCLIIIIISNFFKKPTTNTTILPSPSVAPNNASSGYSTSADQLLEDKKNFQIGLLVNKLPYHGNNFSLYYKYNTDEFILQLNPNSAAAGNKEFDLFLKNNGIGSRMWFHGLILINNDVAPAP